MSTIVLDPVTRIEGHLKVEVTLDTNNIVTAAKSTGNMYRGFENLLINRDPRDAIILTQRICGVCPVPHGVASVKAVESASRFTAAMQANLLRNLVNGANFIHSHILHFYHLAAMDYVQGPGMSPWTPFYQKDLRLSAANTQAIINNYKTALAMRRKANEIQALIGGIFPFVSNLVPGGVNASISATDVANFKKVLAELRSFIENVYQHDVNLIASAYGDYFEIGKGYGNLLSYGVFDTTASGGLLFPAGTVVNGTVGAFNQQNITEHVRYSWYSSPSAVHPGSETTTASYNKSGAYSWIKSPRYSNVAYEVGPLARVWVSGDYRRGISVMDRHAARVVEAIKIVTNMQSWIDQINQGGGNAYTAGVIPVTGDGIGLTEAPRGALGHWISINNSKVARYQVITPTAWNASPMDDNGAVGPIEKALIGTKVADSTKPVELLRIVHSFDPCTSCSVHMLDPKGRDLSRFVVQPVA